MAEVETSNKPTILDYLHEDCWRAVLDYVPVEDIIRSERVSRQWQAVTLVYLQRTRIGIERSYVRVSEAVANIRRVTLAKKRLPLFWRWTCKLGASVVATSCTTEECLETVTKNCPNLEAVTFLTLTEQQLRKIQIEKFKFLQSIRFINCDLSDHFISQFIADKALEELHIVTNEEMTGRFLLDIELTSLKSLQLYGCRALEGRYLLLAAARLTELRRLVLSYVPQDIYKQLHLVFKRTVKLEYLHMCDIAERGCLFEGICQLGRLRHLSVSRVATDADVEAVARCCKELRSLELLNCDAVRVALYDQVWSYPELTPWPRVRWLELDGEEWPLFERWAKKFGSTVVFAFCSSEKQLDIIRKHCPHVESLTVTDCCVSQFMNSNITELEIDDDREEFKMKGQFLNSVKSNLKSLTLIRLRDLRLNYLLSLSDSLSELKKLHLNDLPESIFKTIHLVFDKTPKLEDLFLFGCGLDVSKHVCRLPNLKHLSGTVVSTDEEVEAVARGCKELRYLQTFGNTVSVRGLRAMCRHAGARLVELSIGSNSKLTDEDVVVCVRGCTTLTDLDVSGCSKVTAQLLPLAEEARRGMTPRPPPLRIHRGWWESWTIK